MAIQPSYVYEKSVRFGGTTTDLAELSAEEVAIFRDQIETILMEVTPSVARIINANLDVLINLIRRVKVETKSKFMGAFARGKELTIEMLVADGRNWVTKAGTGITTWLFTATAGLDWFISGPDDAPITVPEEEGWVYLAWADPIETPKATAIQLEKGGDLHVPQNLPWDLTQEFPVIALKEPWILMPEDTYRIQVRYNISGDDKLQPIAFRVVKAETIMTL